MKIFQVNLLALLWVCIATAGPARLTETNPAPRMVAELRDGSRLVGLCPVQRMVFHSDLLGDLKLAPADLRSVECLASNRALVVTRKGDQFAVTTEDATVPLKTSFGEVKLTLNTVRRLTLSASGTVGTHPAGLVALWTGENEGRDAAGHNDLVVKEMNYADGPSGRVFSLDGQQSCMSLTDSSGVNVGPGPGLTLSAWIKPADVNGFHGIVEWNPSQTGEFPGMIGVQLWIGDLPVSRGVLKGTIVGMNGTLYPVTSPPGTLVPNRWQHVALTFDQATGAVLLYVNGAVVAQENFGGPLQPLTRGPLWIGVRPTDHPGDWTYHRYFQGLMNELAIYNRALTPEEIRSEADDAVRKGN